MKRIPMLVRLSCVFAVTVSMVSWAQLPPVPVPAENPVTESKRVLGKILFWEEQLSTDNTVACGTCHIPGVAGADPRPGAHPGPDLVFGGPDDVVGSPGVVRRDSSGLRIEDSTFGYAVQVTNRSAPNFFGALWAAQQFWDGRAESVMLDPLDGSVAIAAGGSLENQALGPLLSSVEMAKDGRSWEEVTSKLAAAEPLVFASDLPADITTALSGSPSYGDLFTSAFGDPDITPVRIAFAIATYERTLVADQTPFDLGTLTPQQAQGLTFFQPPAAGAPPNCGSCHAPPLFTDNTFRNIGVRPPAEDSGRFAITGVAADLGRFKVPTLRNVSTKPTFMHNGSLATMAEIIAFYGPGGQNSAVNLDAAMPVPVPPPLVPAVIDFVENGLTDPRVVNATFPFDAPTLSAAGALVEENVPLPVWSVPLLLLLLVITAIRARYRASQ